MSKDCTGWRKRKDIKKKEKEKKTLDCSKKASN